MGPGGFVPTNPDLADILGRADLDFEIFYFFDFLDPKFLDLQVPRLSNSQIEAGPGRIWTCSSTPLRWLRGGSAALAEHNLKVGEIQGTRTIL